MFVQGKKLVALIKFEATEDRQPVRISVRRKTYKEKSADLQAMLVKVKDRNSDSDPSLTQEELAKA